MDQILLSVLSLIAVALTQGPYRYHRWALVFGMASQPFWLYSTYTAELWGIFFLSCVYTVIWVYGCWNNWIRPQL